jgi:hypothetical protein
MGGREETATWQGNDTCNKTQVVCGGKAVKEKECKGQSCHREGVGGQSCHGEGVCEAKL